MTRPKRTGPPEVSLADFVPLWRTLDEDGVAALVTPALDYVGVLEVGTVDARFASSEAITGLGEALRALVSGSEDGWTLHFLARVLTDASGDIADYRRVATQRPLPGPLAAYVEARVEWLGAQPLRRTRLFLAFSRGSGLGPRPPGGVKMLFANLAKHSEARHREEVSALKAMRNALTARLQAAGLPARPLDAKAVR
ncbi:MAG: hypothetical protein SFW67_36970, partial [Myxococcaceae bacterium]|nr:hypothetical protein [Myxococcaceae bacterium]